MSSITANNNTLLSHFRFIDYLPRNMQGRYSAVKSSSANNSCLYASTSILLFGNSYHVDTLRLATIIQAVTKFDQLATDVSLQQFLECLLCCDCHLISLCSWQMLGACSTMGDAIAWATSETTDSAVSQVHDSGDPASIVQHVVAQEVRRSLPHVMLVLKNLLSPVITTC